MGRSAATTAGSRRLRTTFGTRVAQIGERLPSAKIGTAGGSIDSADIGAGDAHICAHPRIRCAGSGIRRRRSRIHHGRPRIDGGCAEAGEVNNHANRTVAGGVPLVVGIVAIGYPFGASQGEAVRMLAVAMEERHPLFPDVPTFKELGYDMTGGAYRGIALPNSASAETTKMWSDMIADINADPEFQKKMLDGGFAMLDINADGMADFMAAKGEEYLKDAREAKLIK